MSKISDELRDYGRRLVSNASPFNCTFGDIRAYQDELADRIDREMLELPRDRDGVPIHVGDTVYLDDGRKAKVARIQLSERENTIGFTLCGNFFAVWPEDLTHARPDSWERIANELEEWCDGADVDGDACDVPRGIADRIRKLAKRKEGK